MVKHPPVKKVNNDKYLSFVHVAGSFDGAANVAKEFDYPNTAAAF